MALSYVPVLYEFASDAEFKLQCTRIGGRHRVFSCRRQLNMFRFREMSSKVWNIKEFGKRCARPKQCQRCAALSLRVKDETKVLVAFLEYGRPVRNSRGVCLGEGGPVLHGFGGQSLHFVPVHKTKHMTLLSNWGRCWKDFKSGWLKSRWMRAWNPWRTDTLASSR